MYGGRDPYYDYGNHKQPNYDQRQNEPYPSYPPPPSPQPEPYGYPGYPPYQPPPSGEKSWLIPVIIIVVIIVVLLPVLAGVFYVWTSGFEGGGSSNGGGEVGVSVSATTSDNNIKYDIEITKVSGGTLRLSDVKFKVLSVAGSELLKKQ